MPDRYKDIPVFVRWVEFLAGCLSHGKNSLRRVRFQSSASRIDALALDVVEDLVEARYSKDKREILKRANPGPENPVLLRLCHEQQFSPRRFRVRHPWCGRNRSDAGRVDETAGGEMTTTDMAEKFAAKRCRVPP